MKRFEVYKNIRKRAVIFGLPISLFALMMVAILASLLIIIFSFSFGMIIGVLIFNASLYVALTRITNNPQLFQMAKAFPKIISNKRNSGFDYEQD
jgi:type IV secretory pathway VirB3-like protein